MSWWASRALVLSAAIHLFLLLRLSFGRTSMTTSQMARPISGGGKEQWESTGLSDSTTGRKWKARKVRSYSGPRLDHAVLAATKRFAPAQGKQCTHFAVVTTIFSPTEMAEQLDKLKPWCAVFVGDKKSPPKAEWTAKFPPRTSNVVFIDVTDQEALPFALRLQTPWNHFSRKNLGFLYAMYHGAQVIYDTDDDNVLTNKGADMAAWGNLMNSSSTTAVPEWKSTHPLCNPYIDFKVAFEHSGEKTFAWPRGFPLDFIRDAGTYEQVSTLPDKPVSMARVGVVQALANHDPDVDGIYRLTQRLPLSFADKRRLAVLPMGTLAPYNAQATLVAHDAFWALLLPASVHGRVSDIWRSLLFQRIMWNAGLRLAFASPFVNQFRNAHDYLADFNSELPLYTQAGELARFLLAWETTATTVPALVEDLMIAAYETGLLEVSDVALAQAWLRDLAALGYAFPAASTPFSPVQMPQAKIVDGRGDGG